MTVIEAYDNAVSAYGNLVTKFGAYVEASSYDGKKDFGKWLAALDEAIAKDDRSTIKAVLKDAVPEFGSNAA